MLTKGITIGLVTVPLLVSGCDGFNANHQQAPKTKTTIQSTAQDEANYTITANAAGPVQLGMNSADIIAALPGATASTEKDGEGITWMTLTSRGETLMSILLDDNDHSAVLIRIMSPKFVTEQGVRVGENLQSAGEKLGGLTEIQWTEIESREFATFANNPPTLEFQVVGNDGTAGIYANNEKITNTASPSARIHSIWINEDM